jgi:predicted ATP-dependent serine protease
MNDGLLYIYDGPPVISGDRCCNKCGGTEFRWVGVCTKCYDKELEVAGETKGSKWEELKKILPTRFQELKQQQCSLMEDRETKNIPNLMLRTENRGMRRMLTEIMQTMSDMEEK